MRAKSPSKAKAGQQSIDRSIDLYCSSLLFFLAFVLSLRLAPTAPRSLYAHLTHPTTSPLLAAARVTSFPHPSPPASALSLLLPALLGRDVEHYTCVTVGEKKEIGYGRSVVRSVVLVVV
jgi:hypothetical protein